VLGTFFDLDASSDRAVEILSSSYLTIRINEAVTQHGYAWAPPTHHEWTCVDELDDNFGDYVTGYFQYLLQAKNVNEHCTEEITLTRS